MAVQALYRRWRPQRFEEVIGQEHITRTLANAVASGRLVHAYLFTGPRGTGKTSVARILAKAVNCTGDGEKPCNACPMCQAITEGRALDLIEIDAASNTGVDDVRDLREKIGFAPNEATYKVYIIDESHMLSTAAFNALLKTLEEPPPHALFILATTEPHKIPDTILSRCQRHDFRRVPLDLLVGKLERICQAEGIAAEPAALERIARSATGSIRDAESLLDQLMAGGETITVADVQAALGTPADDAVSGIIDAIVARDAAAGLRLLNAALDHGADPRQLRGLLLEHLRGLLLIQTGVEPELLHVDDETLQRMRAQAAGLSTLRLADAIHRFHDARPSPDRTQPALALELALVEAVLAQPDSASSPPAVKLSAVAVEKRSREAQAAEPRPKAGAAPRAGGEPKAGTTPEARATPTAGAGPADVADTSPPAGQGVQKARGEVTEVVAGAEDEAAAPADGEAADEPGPEGGSQTPDSRARVAGTEKVEGKAARPAGLGQLQTQWDAITAAVARRDKNTAALLKDCRPVGDDGDTVTLGFFYEFHCQRVSEPQRHAMVRQAISEVLGGPRGLRCTVVAPTRAEAARPRSRSDQAKADPLIRHAIEELGARIAGLQPPGEDE